MIDLKCTNSEARFVRGIRIENLNFICDLDLYASHQRLPSQWYQPSFNLIKESNSIYLQLIIPQNCIHFKIIYSGSALQDLSRIRVEFDFEISLSTLDILSHLKKSKIVFVGCARNCVSKIDDSINTLLNLSQYFCESDVLIFENDSIDGTTERLKKYSTTDAIKLLQYDNLDFHFPKRTQRLSFARNQLLIEANKKNYDYYCVTDLDGVIGNDFDSSSFLSNFKFANCWDAVFPINKGIYYDVWAFRHPDIWPWDYEREMNSVTPLLGDKNLLDFYVSRFQNMNFRDLNAWLEVDSAFGGMGLYKFEKFRFSTYFGLSGSNQVCEHTVFHEKSRKLGAKLYINPEFIVNGI